jgi:hypothetical protein
MAERDEQYEAQQGEVAGQWNAVDAYILQIVQEEVAKVKAKRMPRALQWARVVVHRLPPRQVFATPDHFAYFLIEQYRAKAQRSPDLALDCLEVIILPDVANRVWNEQIAEGRALDCPRPTASTARPRFIPRGVLS